MKLCSILGREWLVWYEKDYREQQGAWGVTTVESQSANTATPVPGDAEPSSGLFRYCMLVLYIHTFGRQRMVVVAATATGQMSQQQEVNLSRQSNKVFPLNVFMSERCQKVPHPPRRGFPQSVHSGNDLTDPPRGMSLH